MSFDLVVVSTGNSLVEVHRLLLWWLFLLGNMGARVHKLQWPMGSIAVAPALKHRLNSCGARA